MAFFILFSRTNDFFVHWFCKLGFCSVSFNATLALVGQLFKNLHRSSIGSVPISTFPIHIFRSQGHEFLLLCLFFLSVTESHQVSMNDIFMRLSTRHNLETGGQIKGPSTSLVSWHVITSRWPSPSCFHGPICLEITKKTHVAGLRKHYVSRDHNLYYSCTKI